MQSYLPAYIRNKNRALVLDLFLRHWELTRADITKLSSISFPTVMKIVDYFLSRGLVAEVEGTTAISDSRLGRKGQLLRLNAAAYSTVGIHFEGNYLLVGLVDLTNRLLDQKAFPFRAFREEFSSPGGFDRISARMTDTIRQFRSVHTETRIVGAGVAFPGIIDGETRQVIRREMGSAVSFDQLFHTFSEIEDMPVYIENDMNAASLGEWLLRKGEAPRNLIYLALGTGFGGGIIIDGEIWRGTANFAGNIGSMLTTFRYGETADQIDPRRLENQINIAAIRERFGVDIREDEVPEALRQEISAYVADYMIPLIYNLGYILDATNYVIAGVVPEVLGDALFQRIDGGLQRLLSPGTVFPAARVMPTVCKDAGVVGAAAIAFQHCLPELLGDDG